MGQNIDSRSSVAALAGQDIINTVTMPDQGMKLVIKFESDAVDTLSRVQITGQEMPFNELVGVLGAVVIGYNEFEVSCPKYLNFLQGEARYNFRLASGANLSQLTVYAEKQHAESIVS